MDKLDEHPQVLNTRRTESEAATLLLALDGGERVPEFVEAEARRHLEDAESRALTELSACPRRRSLRTHGHPCNQRPACRLESQSAWSSWSSSSTLTLTLFRVLRLVSACFHNSPGPRTKRMRLVGSSVDAR